MVWCCVVRRAAVGYHDSAFSDACTAKLNNSYTDLWKLFFPRATPANDPKGSLSEDFLCKFILGLAEVHTGVMDSKYDLLLFVIAVFYVRRRLSARSYDKAALEHHGPCPIATPSRLSTAHLLPHRPRFAP